MPRPNEEDVTSAVENAIQTLLKEDDLLFQRGASEWSIAHRLGVYLEVCSEDFTGWKIDCEFNRQPYNEEGSEFVSNQTKKVAGDIRRPDIIVHKRANPETGFEGDNLLAIELKVNKVEDGDTNHVEEIVENKEYDFGVFIDFYENPRTLEEWNPSHLEWRPEELNR